MSPPLDNEWIYSMMETRLRHMVTGLVTPSLETVAEHTLELKTLRDIVVEQADQMSSLRTAHAKLVEVDATVRGFQAQLGDMEKRIQEADAAVLQEREAARQQRADLKTAVHHTEEHISTNRRALDQAASEIGHLQEGLREVRDLFPDRLDQHERQVHKQKCELEVKITNLELKHNALTDQLWGEELGLARVSGEIRRAKASLAEFDAVLRDLKAATVRPDDLAKVQEDVTSQISRSDSLMRDLSKMVGEAVHDVKEHLQTGLKAAGTHYAAFAEEVRRSYTEELKVSKELRREVEGIMAEVRERLAVSDRASAEAAARSGQLVGELREALELAERRRKSDRASLELEFKGFKNRIGALSDHTTSVLAAFSQLSGVLGMTLEAVRLQCALEQQDNADREHVHLLGLREEAAAAPAPPPPQAPPNPASPSGSPRPRRPLPRGGRPPVVSVDQRCLSCSGQARTVLSAFKIACLQYNPSPVTWEDKDHSRVELLQHMERLVEKAQGCFSSVLAEMLTSSNPASPAQGCFSSVLAEMLTSSNPASPVPPEASPVAAARGPLPGVGTLKEYSQLLSGTSKAEERDSRRLPSLARTAGPAAHAQAAVLT